MDNIKKPKSISQIVASKSRTSFIGALARFEHYFGHLWGHGKSQKDCTENELAWRREWENCRTDILNHANHQLRSIEKELNNRETNTRNSRQEKA
jgi:hypothetical protein